MTDREKWLNGWTRSGREIWMGQSVCAGCGKMFGVACIVVDENAVFPDKDPDFPFDESTCPVCTGYMEMVRAGQIDITAEDLSKLPLSLLRQAIAIKKSINS